MSVTGGAGGTTVAAGPSRRGLGGLLGRASWNLIDQMLSALTNAVLGVMVARQSSKEEFGAFGISFLIFMLMIGIERGVVGAVLGIRHSDHSPEQMRDVARRALGTSAAIGLPAGVACVVVGIVLGGLLGPPLIAIGVTMAGLLMQDTVRMLYLADGRAKLATGNDALWAVLQFSTIGVLIAAGAARTWALVLAWGCSAVICVVVACVQMRVTPRISVAADWVREHRDLVGYMLAQNLLTSGAMQASVLFVGKIIGVAGVGALRAVAVIFGPLPIAQTAAMTFAVPEVSRRKELAPRVLVQIGVVVSAALVALTLTYLAFLLWLPDAVGHFLFKDSWDGARSVIVPMAVFYVAACACVGPAMIIIARGHARRTMLLTMFEGPLFIGLMAVGAVMDGARGAVWGQFLAQAVEIPFWFWQLYRVAHLPFQRGDDDDDGGTDVELATTQSLDLPPLVTGRGPGAVEAPPVF